MTYRILSFDGGGTWALLQAMALEKLYPGKTGHQILADFDLAVANSGGSITLMGLMKDLSAAEIIGLFGDEANRRSIFADNKGFQWHDLFLKAERYSTAGKLKGLEKLSGALGQTPMDQLQPHLPTGPNGEPVKILIIGFDYDRQRAEYFRSFVSGLGAQASPARLVDAVHASTNAPVLYFDKPTECLSSRYWDGAIAGYNNPLMAGVTEAFALGKAPKEIQARSIGTGTVRLAPPKTRGNAPPQLVEKREKPGFIHDLQTLAGSINDDPPDAASFTAYFALGNRPSGQPVDSGSLVRLSPVIQPIWKDPEWVVPPGLTPETFALLANMDMDVLEKEKVDWLKWLGRSWFAGDIPNQGVRVDSTTLTCKIGDATFAAGAARW